MSRWPSLLGSASAGFKLQPRRYEITEEDRQRADQHAAAHAQLQPLRQRRSARAQRSRFEPQLDLAGDAELQEWADRLGDDSGVDEEVQPQPTSGGVSTATAAVTTSRHSTTYQSKLAAREEAWRQLKPELEMLTAQQAAAACSMGVVHQHVGLMALQHELKAAATAACWKSGCAGQLRWDGGTRQVTYQGAWYSAPLEVPVVCCGGCGHSGMLPAAAAGCFPNTPAEPTTWYDQRMLAMFHAMQHSAAQQRCLLWRAGHAAAAVGVVVWSGSSSSAAG